MLHVLLYFSNMTPFPFAGGESCVSFDIHIDSHVLSQRAYAYQIRCK